MAEEKEPVKTIQEDPQPKKRSMFKWIGLIGIVVLLGIGGFLGWNLFFKGQGRASMAKETKASQVERASVIVPLKSFIVNLADKTGQGKRYLKLTMELEVGGEEAKIRLDKQEPQIRDTVLMLLSGQTLTEITTIDGKIEMKQALTSRINQILGGDLVRSIYFTEFVVQ
jgi:flagellar protein FliL